MLYPELRVTVIVIVDPAAAEVVPVNARTPTPVIAGFARVVTPAAPDTAAPLIAAVVEGSICCPVATTTAPL